MNRPPLRSDDFLPDPIIRVNTGQTVWSIPTDSSVRVIRGGSYGNGILGRLQDSDSPLVLWLGDLLNDLYDLNSPFRGRLAFLTTASLLAIGLAFCLLTWRISPKSSPSFPLLPASPPKATPQPTAPPITPYRTPMPSAPMPYPTPSLPQPTRSPFPNRSITPPLVPDDAHYRVPESNAASLGGYAPRIGSPNAPRNYYQNAPGAPMGQDINSYGQ